MGARAHGGGTAFLGAGRRRGMLPAGLLAALAVLVPTHLLPPSAGAADATIEAASDGIYGYVWRPASATIPLGGTVAFRSTGPVPHNVSWRSGPETPACEGVPGTGEPTGWDGTCSFSQAGSYSFVCGIHPVEMKGTISVGSGGGAGPAPPGAPSGAPSGSPLAGAAARALKLGRSQRGASVRGSIALSAAAAGGRVLIDVRARRSALAKGARAGTVRVGRLVRTGVTAGRLAFTVRLRSSARRALRVRGRLAAVVTITVDPPQGDTVRLRRGVVLHG